MRNLTKITLSACIGLTLGLGQAFAGAKPDQVHRLSEDLTPMGSERAGNAEGTIPEWTGGITQPPAGYSPGDHHPSPWPDDKPLGVRFSATDWRTSPTRSAPASCCAATKCDRNSSVACR